MGKKKGGEMSGKVSGHFGFFGNCWFGKQGVRKWWQG